MGIREVTIMQKGLPDRKSNLSQEGGFVHVPAFDADTSLLEELDKLRVIFKRREKTILGVYLGVFLLSLFPLLEQLSPLMSRLQRLISLPNRVVLKL